MNLWDCRPGIQFPVVKLLDFESRWEELEQSNNPFAFVVMAHLQAVRTRRKPQSRLEWKLRIARGLISRGHSKEDVLHLVRYIDWIMTLPTQLEKRFKTTLEEEAQEKKMSFMTVWERQGHEEGLREGIHQEGVAAVLEVLEERFGTHSSRLRRELERIEDAARLRRLLRRAVSVETIAAFEQDLGLAG